MDIPKWIFILLLSALLPVMCVLGGLGILGALVATMGIVATTVGCCIAAPFAALSAFICHLVVTKCCSRTPDQQEEKHPSEDQPSNWSDPTSSETLRATVESHVSEKKTSSSHQLHPLVCDPSSVAITESKTPTTEPEADERSSQHDMSRPSTSGAKPDTTDSSTNVSGIMASTDSTASTSGNKTAPTSDDLVVPPTDNTASTSDNKTDASDDLVAPSTDNTAGTSDNSAPRALISGEGSEGPDSQSFQSVQTSLEKYENAEALALGESSVDKPSESSGPNNKKSEDEKA